MQGVNGRVFDLGIGALRAHQQGIAVSGQNIANVNTPGYSRQRVVLETNIPFIAESGQMQAGVHVDSIERIHDRFIEGQVRGENRELGRWVARSEILGRLEMTFDESYGYGLSQAMSDFFSGWLDLSNDPSGHVERTVLIERGEYLADRFRLAYTDLVQIREDLDAQLQIAVQQINEKAAQIAELNLEIAQFESTGQNANELRDKRDLLLKELSYLIDIGSIEDEEGMASVSVGSGGKPLVSKNSVWELTVSRNALGNYDVAWIDSSGTEVVMDIDEIRGGQIKGWLEARDVEIADAMTRLDDLAGSMITEINALHAGGFGTDSATGLPTGGTNFFIGGSASDIRVSATISDDIGLIAAAGSADGVPGDNSNALAIANLQDAPAMDGGSTSFGGYYDSLVGSIGSVTQSANTQTEYHADMMTHLENYRESVSGVNLDEEMVNLIQYQKAYEAAAKLISVSDEMLDVLMNMI